MAERIEKAAVRLGIPEAGRDLVALGLELAMAPRRSALTDDHDPRFLHPGRCVAILQDDLSVADPVLLTAAALVETEYPDLAVGPERIDERLGTSVGAVVSAVPCPGSESVAEDLVLSDLDVRRVALAERLDQLRHAHLWEDMERRRTAHEIAVAVYLPVAERSDETLARRYRWWCRMFGQRYL